MNAPLRVGFIVNFTPSDPPGAWLGSYLPDYRSELLVAKAKPGTFLDRHRWLPPYVAELCQLARHHSRLDSFDVLFAWELRTTLAMILLRRITRHRRPRLISLNPTLKGPMLRVLPLVRLLLRDADSIVCFSTDEQKLQMSQLRLPSERFHFVPRFAEPRDGTEGSQPPGKYAAGFIMSLGHSNRDFPTLWEALRPTQLPVVMYRNAWMRGRELSNVRSIPAILPAADEEALVGQAAFHVIPLKPAAFSSGLTVLLRAMAHGKAVVVSNTTGIRDYVRDGETAVLVPAGDPVALRDAMQRLWQDTEERQRIGRNAALAVRDHFATPLFARRLADIAQSVTQADGRLREARCASS